MKIDLYNLGIIKHFTYDTQDDFTIIFGKNNSGKSYAISAVYLIIKNILNMSEPIFFRYGLSKFDLKGKTSSLQKQLENKKKINIKKDIEKILSEYFFKDLLEELQESFKNTFDSIENLNNKFSNEDLSIVIETKLIKFIIKANEKSLYISTLDIKKERIDLIKSDRDLSNKYETKVIKIYTSNTQDKFSTELFSLIMDLSQGIVEELNVNIKRVYYLPASRSGLYQALSAFGQIIAELSKSRKFTSKKVELPSISEPLSDYFLELSNIKLRDNENQNKITEIATEIENNILNGTIEFDENTKKIMFRPNSTNLKLDLSYTSSMVSELSPIVSYLRYILNDSDDESNLSSFVKKRKKNNAKPLIIIEEPEAHLHPDIQVELLKQFAELAKNDVKFIITTHSNYMFNKFNNLILGKDINTEYATSLLFKETPSGSDVITMDLDELGVEDENFIYTSENLYNEKVDLIDKINEENK